MARVEVGRFEHEGRVFEALGSVVDHEAGHVTGYVRDDERAVTTWHGEFLGTLERIGHYTASGTRVNSYRAFIDGRAYYGRGQGAGMVLHLRAKRAGAR